MSKAITLSNSSYAVLKWEHNAYEPEQRADGLADPQHFSGTISRIGCVAHKQWLRHSSIQFIPALRAWVMQYSTYNTCCQRHALRHHSCFSDITFTSALVQEKLSKSGKKKSEFFLLLLQSFFQDKLIFLTVSLKASFKLIQHFPQYNL